MGSEEVYDLDLQLPPEAGSFQILGTELPLPRLPAGKSASLIAIRTMGGGGRDHFDVRVVGRTADGEPIAEDVFLSLAE